MEKMEVEKKFDESLSAGEKDSPKNAKWIIDPLAGTKSCSECGSAMRGWAFRETFFYCPICGVKMG